MYYTSRLTPTLRRGWYYFNTPVNKPVVASHKVTVAVDSLLSSQHPSSHLIFTCSDINHTNHIHRTHRTNKFSLLQATLIEYCSGKPHLPIQPATHQTTTSAGCSGVPFFVPREAVITSHTERCCTTSAAFPTEHQPPVDANSSSKSQVALPQHSSALLRLYPRSFRMRETRSCTWICQRAADPYSYS